MRTGWTKCWNHRISLDPRSQDGFADDVDIGSFQSTEVQARK